MCSNYCKREKEMGTRIKEYKYEVCSKETDIQYRRVVPSVVRFPDPLVYPTNQTAISSELGNLTIPLVTTEITSVQRHF